MITINIIDLNRTIKRLNSERELNVKIAKKQRKILFNDKITVAEVRNTKIKIRKATSEILKIKAEIGFYYNIIDAYDSYKINSKTQ